MIRLLLVVALLGRTALAQDSTLAYTSTGDVATSSRVYTVVREESDDIHVAIDRAVEHMNFIARPIARHRLRSTNPLPEHLRLDITPDTIVVYLGDAPPAALPRDGTEVRWKDIDGDECRVSAILTGDTLTEHIIAHGGQSETRYVLLDSGHRVREEVRISSPHLPAPVIYSVMFTKTEN
jgi:hypothetical protein